LSADNSIYDLLSCNHVSVNHIIKIASRFFVNAMCLVAINATVANLIKTTNDNKL
jgi:hypothetical protein